MAKKKIQEESLEEAVITDADYKHYREGINGLGVKYVNGCMLPPFEQFCIKQGVAIVNDAGFFTITDLEHFGKWIRVRDSVEANTAFKADELRRLFPEEQEKHRERFRKLRDFMVQLGIAKKYDTVS